MAVRETQEAPSLLAELLSTDGFRENESLYTVVSIPGSSGLCQTYGYTDGPG